MLKAFKPVRQKHLSYRKKPSFSNAGLAEESCSGLQGLKSLWDED